MKYILLLFLILSSAAFAMETLSEEAKSTDPVELPFPGIFLGVVIVILLVAWTIYRVHFRNSGESTELGTSKREEKNSKEDDYDLQEYNPDEAISSDEDSSLKEKKTPQKKGKKKPKKK
jgi:flagellar biosynthesis/type III secretory pathway M-ring protein FliF/YscJ